MRPRHVILEHQVHQSKDHGVGRLRASVLPETKGMFLDAQETRQRIVAAEYLGRSLQQLRHKPLHSVSGSKNRAV